MPIKDMIWNGTRFDTIDADTLDGYDNLQFVKTNAGSTNADTLLKTGFYRYDGDTPAGAKYGQMIVSSAGGDTILQISGDYTSSRLQWRGGNPPGLGGAGNFGAWRNIYHEGYKPSLNDLGIRYGTSTFVGNSNARTVAHGLGRVPSSVQVTPNANPGGNLGEYWVTYDATNIYVFNSGSAVTGFCWTAL